MSPPAMPTAFFTCHLRKFCVATNESLRPQRKKKSAMISLQGLLVVVFWGDTRRSGQAGSVIAASIRPRSLHILHTPPISSTKTPLLSPSLFRMASISTMATGMISVKWAEYNTLKSSREHHFPSCSSSHRSSTFSTMTSLSPKYPAGSHNLCNSSSANPARLTSSSTRKSSRRL